MMLMIRLRGETELMANLDARHRGRCLLGFRLEDVCHEKKAAKDHGAKDPRDNQKPDEAWHVAKLLLARFCPNLT
jgi:hypothetical protein